MTGKLQGLFRQTCDEAISKVAGLENKPQTLFNDCVVVLQCDTFIHFKAPGPFVKAHFSGIIKCRGQTGDKFLGYSFGHTFLKAVLGKKQ